ncbi:MAG: ParB N-terminal domain-containing protein [Gemmataceae bacterium]
MPTPFECRTLPIDQLTPAPYNPRRMLKPTDKACRKLKHSLERFGLVEPLVWNELTGRVVGGHLRLSILKELGYVEVPVSVVRLTDPQEKALNVVLNNQEAQNRYDTDKLADLLTELADLPELDDTGFDDTALAALRFEPLPDLPPDPRDPDRVEVTLVMTAAMFDRVQGRVDELVSEFDLENHVRRG